MESEILEKLIHDLQTRKQAFENLDTPAFQHQEYIRIGRLEEIERMIMFLQAMQQNKTQ